MTLLKRKFGGATIGNALAAVRHAEKSKRREGQAFAAAALAKIAQRLVLTE